MNEPLPIGHVDEWGWEVTEVFVYHAYTKRRRIQITATTRYGQCGYVYHAAYESRIVLDDGTQLLPHETNYKYIK